MNLDVPIFAPTTAGAAFEEPGLHLAVDGPWLHGALVVAGDHGAPAERWHRALVAVAVSQSNQVPRVGRITRAEALSAARAWESFPSARAASAGRAEGAAAAGRVGPVRRWRLTFATPARSVLGERLADEVHYAHVAALDLVSNGVELEPRAHATRASGTLGDRLVLAYDHALAGDFGAATAGFDEALAEPAVRDDLDAAHAYNAACVFARAAHRERASSLLAQDLQRRCARHTRALLATAVARGREEGVPARAALDGLLDAHIARLRSDPDLEALRASGAIEAMLEAL
jgi:hypothetical protein